METMIIGFDYAKCANPKMAYLGKSFPKSLRSNSI